MKLVLVFKGGPRSGHHGHAGRPGHRGGSVPGSVAVSIRTGRAAAIKRGWKPPVDPKWDSRMYKGKPVTVYHATPEECVDAIEREGLIGGITAEKIAGGARAVYFTTNEEDALMYGEGSGYSGKFGIVEFTIPEDRHHDVVFDDYDFEMYGAEDSFYIPGDVPREWIQHIRIYEETALGGFRRTKQKLARNYSVVFIKDEMV